jgi:hypothetical protein
MDGMAQDSHEIVSHNYAPFNAAVAKYIEKLEQPDPRIAGQAFREKARGVGHVLKALGVAALLTLIGVSLVVLCKQGSATAPKDTPQWPVIHPSPPSGPTVPEPHQPRGAETVVTNFTLFKTVRIAEGVEIVTGWRFVEGTDDKPERQYCYLSTPQEFGSRTIQLAQRSQSGELIRQSSAGIFNGYIREIDYETALSKCVWFSK